MELHCAEIVIGSGTLKMAGNGWFNQTESVKMAKETILNNYKIFSC